MAQNTFRVIVGLGNPGQRYAQNRHNVGYWVVEEIARRHKLSFVDSGNGYLIAQQKIGASQSSGELLILIKPLTYMNLSGEAVAQWSRDTGVSVTGEPPRVIQNLHDIEDLEKLENGIGSNGLEGFTGKAEPTPWISVTRPLVVCDDLALPLGSVRLRAKGSSGGQNGLASVIDALQGEVFPRVRLGIAGGDGLVPPEFWPDYVLADFDEDEHAPVREMVIHAADMLDHWLEHGLEKAASRYNRRYRPSTDSNGDPK